MTQMKNSKNEIELDMDERGTENQDKQAPRKYRAIPPDFTPRTFVKKLRIERNELKEQLELTRKERDEALEEVKRAKTLIRYLLFDKNTSTRDLDSNHIFVHNSTQTL